MHLISPFHQKYVAMHLLMTTCIQGFPKSIIDQKIQKNKISKFFVTKTAKYTHFHDLSSDWDQCVISKSILN